MAIGWRSHGRTTFPLVQREDYKFRLEYCLTPEEIVVQARYEVQAQETADRRGYPKNHTIRMHEGDNFPFYGFPKPCYIIEKGLLVPRQEIFNNRH